MKLVSYNQIEKLIKKYLKSNKNWSIQILSYKKDRYIQINKNNLLFTVKEHGYKKNIFTNLNNKEALKIFKKLQKFEFPHSKNLYVNYKELTLDQTI